MHGGDACINHQVSCHQLMSVFAVPGMVSIGSRAAPVFRQSTKREFCAAEAFLMLFLDCPGSQQTSPRNFWYASLCCCSTPPLRFKA